MCLFISESQKPVQILSRSAVEQKRLEMRLVVNTQRLILLILCPFSIHALSDKNAPSKEATVAIQEAIHLLHSYGYQVTKSEPFQSVPRQVSSSFTTKTTSTDDSSTNDDKSNDGHDDDDGDNDDESPDWFLNLLATALCVLMAAVAAGLTVGMLSLDPLMLLIKERAGATDQEKKMAATLLPIVRQHHRLLVTLLLLNSIANEALPIFLEALVPPTVAVLLSVTLVLFFGEIIPSAIFTGPEQMAMAAKLVPLVKIAMLVLYPLAGPIAALLDLLLHDEEEKEWKRGELSALIRIQYEERLAAKRRRKQAAQLQQRQDSNFTKGGDHVGGLDFTNSFRAIKRQVERQSSSDGEIRLVRSDSLHGDEVIMVEGALQMKTKTALDVMTTANHVFSVPLNMLLTERNMVRIYASGHTRVPVYDKDNSAIIGILLAKQLIVVNPKDQRPVRTLPLRRPTCVGPYTSLVDLLNLFQTGGKGMAGGHMALVCGIPKVAEEALAKGLPLPESAAYMGVITLEDVIEALLQEQIYDEMDKFERNADKLASMVVKKWRRYVSRKKAGLLQANHSEEFQTVVEHVIATAIEEDLVNEATALLQVK